MPDCDRSQVPLSLPENVPQKFVTEPELPDTSAVKEPEEPGPVHVPESVPFWSDPEKVYPPPDTSRGPDGGVNVPESTTSTPPVMCSVPLTVSVVASGMIAEPIDATAGVIVSDRVPPVPLVPVTVPAYDVGCWVGLFEL